MKFLLQGYRLMGRHRWYSVVFLIATFSQSYGRVGTIWLMKNFLERVLVSSPGHPGVGGSGLVMAATYILLCWTFRSAADFMAKLSEQWLLREVSLRTMTDLVRHMLSMSVAFME